MPRGNVLAHGFGCNFIIADRAQHPSPRRIQCPLAQPHEHQQHHGEQADVQELDPKRRRFHRVEPEASRLCHKTRVVLQVDLIGHRARDADNILDAARQPVLVLEHSDDDFRDAQGGNRKVIRPQPKRGFSDQPGSTGGQQPANRPGKDHR